MNFVTRILRIGLIVVMAALCPVTGSAAAAADTPAATGKDGTSAFSPVTAETRQRLPAGDTTPRNAIFGILIFFDLDDDAPTCSPQTRTARAWPRYLAAVTPQQKCRHATWSFLRPRPTGPPAA
jgi:hypothetical protein